jgi:predicted lipoprotein with Yx(FWY)xxD motif
MRGRTIRWVLPLLLLVPLGVGAAVAAGSSSSSSGTVKAVRSTSFGTILVSSRGRTLYRYTIDRRGVNRCSSDAACNKYWPPLLVKAGTKPTAGSGAQASKVGTIKARNGMRQVTYAGFPLYLFVGDSAAGQTKGQGFEKEWYVVNTKGALVRHEVATTPTTTTTGGTAWG